MATVTVPKREVVAAGLILRRHVARGSRWLLLRGSRHREWGFPKGHQEPGESLLDTALRECAEETGIGLVAIEGHPLELHYTLPSGRTKRSVYFPAVTASSAFSLSKEHSHGGWYEADEVQRLLPYPNLRALFKAAAHAAEG